MYFKSEIRRVVMVLLMMCIMIYATSLFVFTGSLDDLSSGQNDASGSYGTENNGNASNDDNAIADYLRGYTPVTGDNMKSASTVANPIVNFLGTVAGAIIMIASAAIFCVTALDLCYIGLPFCRGWLNPEYASGGGAQAGGGMPMGGMMGRGMGMGGMMGGGMMGGGAQAGGAVEHGLRRKWVSDEAVFCVNTYAAGGQQAQGAQGGMPMGGMMGGGMMGGGMMGAGGGAQQQAVPMKSVIYEYLKKRVFFVIVFAVCTVLLMSSVLTDCGINIAQLAIKVLTKINGAIGGVNV